MGYVTRGRGVAIHRADCINVLHATNSEKEMNRFIPVRWADDRSTSFQTMLYITATDRNALLIDIMSAVADIKIPVTNVNARTGKNNLAIIELTMEIGDTEQLNKTIKRIKQVEGILSVVRRRQ